MLYCIMLFFSVILSSEQNAQVTQDEIIVEVDTLNDNVIIPDNDKDNDLSKRVINYQGKWIKIQLYKIESWAPDV